jgi:hypothetical protein
MGFSKRLFAVFGFKLPAMGGMISAYNSNPTFIKNLFLTKSPSSISTTSVL